VHAARGGVRRTLVNRSMRDGVTMRPAIATLLAGAALWAAPALPQDRPVSPAPAAAERPAPAFTAEAIKAAVSNHIQTKLDEGGGIYRLVDTRTGEKLDLEFVDIALVGVADMSRVHNPGEGAGGAYFACANFRRAGASKDGPREKLYDVDLSLAPRNGALEITEVFVHKEPRLVDGKWVRVPRPTKR